MRSTFFQAAVASSFFASNVRAQSRCSNVLVPSYKAPSVASGWTAQLIATGLKKPRSIQVDSSGGLLVVESGKGVTRLTFKDNGGTCLEVDQTISVVNDTSLNHGLALSNDGRILYASSVEAVQAWAYDANSGTINGNPMTVVNKMSNNDLTTRTLFMSKKQDGMLLVSRGSSEDFDIDAMDVNTGLSQVKAFDLKQLGGNPYNFNTEGRRLGWGLRNAVGVTEHPITGGIFTVDMGVDGITRNGADIHEDNPAEELNFHGFLNSSTEHQGGNYGYPSCYSVWDASAVGGGLKVGDQFSMTQNSTLNDTVCAEDFVAPRLALPAHVAPLDIKFTNDGATAFVTYHGSFDKSNPVGYRLVTIAFDAASGQPTAATDSNDVDTDIMSNPDQTKCPSECFRPVGLAWHADGSRLFMSSDSTGEIYVVAKASGTPTSTASGTIVTATGSPNDAAGLWTKTTAIIGAAAVAFSALMAA